MIEYRYHARPPADQRETEELDRVALLAERLRHHLEGDADAIAELHRYNAQSKAIQDRVGSLLENELQFTPELVLSADDGLVTRARPDFFYPLSQTTGVIAEVERGGTTANNHDLKDLWKTHIATNANHLFLVVPNELFNEAGSVRERPFPKVVRRMGAFFQSERSHVDVLSVHIFGY